MNNVTRWSPFKGRHFFNYTHKRKSPIHTLWTREVMDCVPAGNSPIQRSDNLGWPKWNQLMKNYANDQTLGLSSQTANLLPWQLDESPEGTHVNVCRRYSAKSLIFTQLIMPVTLQPPWSDGWDPDTFLGQPTPVFYGRLITVRWPATKTFQLIMSVVVWL